MPSNPHKCDACIKPFLFASHPRISHNKCSRKQSKVLSGATLNDAFCVNKFTYTKKYQVYRYVLLPMKQYYCDTYSIISSENGYPEEYEENLNAK